MTRPYYRSQNPTFYITETNLPYSIPPSKKNTPIVTYDILFLIFALISDVNKS